MNPEKNIENQMEQLAQAIPSGNSFVDGVISRLETSSDTLQKQSIHINLVRRLFMKTSVKFAAAAIVLIAAFLSLTLFNKTVPPAYGMTNVVEKLRSARTIHISNLLYFQKNELFEQNQDWNLEDWIDIEGRRTRTSGIGVHSYTQTGKTLPVLIEHVFDGEYKMQISTGKDGKSVQFYKMTEFQRLLHARQTLEEFLEQISMGPKERLEYIKLGQSRIDNELFDIWEREKLFGNVLDRTTCWVKPGSYEIKYLESWSKNKDSKEDWTLSSKKKIELNLTPPPATFLTEPPAGYGHANTKETAFKDQLICRFFPFETMNVKIAVVFTLPDGCVIMGWLSEDKNSEVSVDKFFENLEMGRDIPQLPLEFYGLKFVEDKELLTTTDAIYYGRHLTYTKKDNKFYEWSIYVPNRNIVTEDGQQRYTLLAKLNPNDRQDPSAKRCIDEPPFIVSFIVSPSEFNPFVLGAMAELSDSGTAPENITYDGILKLAEDIRKSMQN